jgi:hypothetical protein
MKKAIGGEAKSLSESEEYKRRLKKLENFISKNRLVSKEAQMSAMSEGSYKDPRFLNTTGHPLIDQYGMHPFPAEGSGQILSTTDLGMEGPESMFGRSLYGQYNPKEDTIIYDPTKVGLKVINTPIKMQFKKLFAARGKFQQLVDKQKFKYDRGLDLASKADPKDIAQGTLQAHVALKSGKRFQRQLNDVEEKIRKLYKNNHPYG